jgi:uncharacterized membrane protein required for colicin V production
MEWFWRMIDHLQKNAAITALQNLSPVDWFVLAVIFWGMLQGSRKGFSEMFGKLLGMFLVSMLTLGFYPGGALYVNANLPVLSLKVAEPFVFFLLSVFLWVSVSWGINIFGKFLKVEAQGVLKTLGGMVLGVLRMVLLLSFFAQFLLLIPIASLQQIFKPGNTRTGYTISRVAPDLHRLITSPFHKTAFKKPVESYKVGG